MASHGEAVPNATSFSNPHLFQSLLLDTAGMVKNELAKTQTIEVKTQKWCVFPDGGSKICNSTRDSRRAIPKVIETSFARRIPGALCRWHA